MLIIRKDEVNNLIATVSMNKTLSNPYYLFSFQHIASKERVSFVPQVITSNCRYDKFRFIEYGTPDLTVVPPRVNFPYLGQYYYSIYEQLTSGNTDPSLAFNKLESGRAVVIVGNDRINECLFEPYISNDEDFANVIYLGEDEGACSEPTPTPTPTATVTPIAASPTPTPSITPTITPSISCPITTQYLQSVEVDGDKIRLNLWNDSGYTSSANAICDYIVSGSMWGNSGTTYTSTRTFTQGDHQIQFNFSSFLQPGETILYHEIHSVNTSACTCPVNVDIFVRPFSGTGLTNFTTTIQNQGGIAENGRFVITGYFTGYNNTQIFATARIFNNGLIDPTFQIGTGFTTGGSFPPTQLIVTKDSLGRYVYGMIYGDSFNGTPVNSGPIRLTVSGTLDPSFNTVGDITSNASPNPLAIKTDSQNRVYLGGTNLNYPTVGIKPVFRYNDDGSLDNTFAVGSVANFSGGGQSIWIYPDDRVLIAGPTMWSGVSVNRLIRLMPDGSFDPTFSGVTNASTGSNFYYSLYVDENNKIWMGGSFTNFNNSTYDNFIRLNDDGTVDNTLPTIGFTTGSGAPAVRSILKDSNGKILISGQFNFYQGNACGNLVRLNSDGTFDSSFDSDPGALLSTGGNSIGRGFFELSDSKYYFCGSNTATYNGTAIQGTVTVTYQDGSIARI